MLIVKSSNIYKVLFIFAIFLFFESIKIDSKVFNTNVKNLNLKEKFISNANRINFEFNQIQIPHNENVVLRIFNRTSFNPFASLSSIGNHINEEIPKISSKNDKNNTAGIINQKEIITEIKNFFFGENEEKSQKINKNISLVNKNNSFVDKNNNTNTNHTDNKTIIKHNFTVNKTYNAVEFKNKTSLNSNKNFINKTQYQKEILNKSHDNTVIKKNITSKNEKTNETHYEEKFHNDNLNVHEHYIEKNHTNLHEGEKKGDKIKKDNNTIYQNDSNHYQILNIHKESNNKTKEIDKFTNINEKILKNDSIEKHSHEKLNIIQENPKEGQSHSHSENIKNVLFYNLTINISLHPYHNSSYGNIQKNKTIINENDHHQENKGLLIHSIENQIPFVASHSKFNSKNYSLTEKFITNDSTDKNTTLIKKEFIKEIKLTNKYTNNKIENEIKNKSLTNNYSNSPKIGVDQNIDHSNSFLNKGLYHPNKNQEKTDHTVLNFNFSISNKSHHEERNNTLIKTQIQNGKSIDINLNSVKLNFGNNLHNQNNSLNNNNKIKLENKTYIHSNISKISNIIHNYNNEVHNFSKLENISISHHYFINKHHLNNSKIEHFNITIIHDHNKFNNTKTKIDYGNYTYKENNKKNNTNNHFKNITHNIQEIIKSNIESGFHIEKTYQNKDSKYIIDIILNNSTQNKLNHKNNSSKTKNESYLNHKNYTTHIVLNQKGNATKEIKSHKNQSFADSYIKNILIHHEKNKTWNSKIEKNSTGMKLNISIFNNRTIKIPKDGHKENKTYKNIENIKEIHNTYFDHSDILKNKSDIHHKLFNNSKENSGKIISVEKIVKDLLKHENLSKNDETDKKIEGNKPHLKNELSVSNKAIIVNKNDVSLTKNYSKYQIHDNLMKNQTVNIHDNFSPLNHQKDHQSHLIHDEIISIAKSSEEKKKEQFNELTKNHHDHILNETIHDNHKSNTTNHYKIEFNIHKINLTNVKFPILINYHDSINIKNLTKGNHGPQENHTISNKEYLDGKLKLKENLTKNIDKSLIKVVSVVKSKENLEHSSIKEDKSSKITIKNVESISIQEKIELNNTKNHHNNSMSEIKNIFETEIHNLKNYLGLSSFTKEKDKLNSKESFEKNETEKNSTKDKLNYPIKHEKANNISGKLLEQNKTLNSIIHNIKIYAIKEEKPNHNYTKVMGKNSTFKNSSIYEQKYLNKHEKTFNNSGKLFEKNLTHNLLHEENIHSIGGEKPNHNITKYKEISNKDKKNSTNQVQKLIINDKNIILNSDKNTTNNLKIHHKQISSIEEKKSNYSLTKNLEKNNTHNSTDHLENSLLIQKVKSILISKKLSKNNTKENETNNTGQASIKNENDSKNITNHVGKNFTKEDKSIHNSKLLKNNSINHEENSLEKNVNIQQNHSEKNSLNHEQNVSKKEKNDVKDYEKNLEKNHEQKASKKEEKDIKDHNKNLEKNLTNHQQKDSKIEKIDIKVHEKDLEKISLNKEPKSFIHEVKINHDSTKNMQNSSNIESSSKKSVNQNEKPSIKVGKEIINLEKIFEKNIHQNLSNNQGNSLIQDVKETNLIKHGGINSNILIKSSQNSTHHEENDLIQKYVNNIEKSLIKDGHSNNNLTKHLQNFSVKEEKLQKNTTKHFEFPIVNKAQPNQNLIKHEDSLLNKEKPTQNSEKFLDKITIKEEKEYENFAKHTEKNSTQKIKGDETSLIKEEKETKNPKKIEKFSNILGKDVSNNQGSYETSNNQKDKTIKTNQLPINSLVNLPKETIKISNNSINQKEPDLYTVGTPDTKITVDINQDLPVQNILDKSKETPITPSSTGVENSLICKDCDDRINTSLDTPKSSYLLKDSKSDKYVVMKEAKYVNEIKRNLRSGFRNTRYAKINDNSSENIHKNSNNIEEFSYKITINLRAPENLIIKTPYFI